MPLSCDRCTDECNNEQEAACQKAILAGNEEPLHRHHAEVV